MPVGPVKWALGIDKQGRPVPNPAKEPAPDAHLLETRFGFSRSGYALVPQRLFTNYVRTQL